MNIKAKIKGWKNSFIAYFFEDSIGTRAYNKYLSRLITVVKVFFVSTRKFLADECLTKASSITYTIIVSLVPTLTVVLTFYSIFSGVGDKKEDLFKNISLFMLEHNIKLNIDFLFAAISDLIENAEAIGGISAAIMIFSATAMLRSLEKSLNDIWKIKKQRPLVLKVVYYWAALTLGPVMLIAGTTVAAQVSELFSAPHCRSAAFDDAGNLWTTGTKARIQYSPTQKLQLTTITDDRIDFDNQKAYQFIAGEKVFKQQELGIDILEYKKIRFNDIQFIDNEGWIVGSQGIVMHTANGGKTWSLRKWGVFSFNDIHMLDMRHGFMASDNGIILETEDGGKTWKVLEWEGVVNNFSSISFFNNRGIITGSGSIILYTADSGKKWQLMNIKEARRKDRPINLNSAFFVNENIIWLMGNEGVMLKSTDGGKSWKNLKFKEVNYHYCYFFNEKEGMVVGTKGTVTTTVDGGENWVVSKLPTYQINKLIHQKGLFCAVGDNGMIMLSKDRGKTWYGTEGKSIVAFLINFLAPFVIIWLLFFLCYLTLPNTKIPVKDAMLGSAFTGAVWVIFILSFIVYIKAFARGTFAVYGALASIPLFLLMIYASAVIILYGAEVSYTLMHPETYRDLKRALKGKVETHVYYGIAILHHIYEKFESGRGAASFKEILKVCSNNTEEVDLFLAMFVRDGIIVQKDETEYIPANASGNILLSHIIDNIHDISLHIPGANRKSPLRDYLETMFKNMKDSRSKVLGTTTLKDVISHSKG